MNSDELTELYAEEMATLAKEKPITIQITPLSAIAIAEHIQIAVIAITEHIQTDKAADSEELPESTKLAIVVAKQLQSLFNQESITYKMIEARWGIK